MNNSSSWESPNKAGPRVAILLDLTFDPVEGWAMISKLMSEDISFELISHTRNGPDLLPIYSECVFGNANYGLHDCRLQIVTTPADKVAAGTHFDAFAVIGGQGPYYMAGDENLKRLVNGISIGAAVCHGPLVLLGTKWIGKDGPNITAFNGAWIYFRHVMEKYQFLKPGETICDEGMKLFLGNSPLSAKPWAEQLVAAIRKAPMSYASAPVAAYAAAPAYIAPSASIVMPTAAYASAPLATYAAAPAYTAPMASIVMPHPPAPTAAYAAAPAYHAPVSFAAGPRATYAAAPNYSAPVRYAAAHAATYAAAPSSAAPTYAAAPVTTASSASLVVPTVTYMAAPTAKYAAAPAYSAPVRYAAAPAYHAPVSYAVPAYAAAPAYASALASYSAASAYTR